jgi:hypothetical protein
LTNDWKNDLSIRLEDFVDSFVVKGAQQSAVYKAIVDEIGNLLLACERDPDPAEDRPGTQAEEPSIEWPDVVP